jgi:hypothetical protein
MVKKTKASCLREPGRPHGIAPTPKNMAKTTRLLLPFTHGVEMDTIDAAVLLAASHQATLVSLSLISVPQVKGKGARLEHIQQSKDFLEAVRYIAVRHRVPLERLEVFTGDTLQSVLSLVDQLGCDGILLALRGRNGSLLSAETIGQLREMRSCPLYLMQFPSRRPFAVLRVTSWVPRLLEHFSHWWQGYRHQVGEQESQQPAPEVQLVDQEVVLPSYSSTPELERSGRS